MAEISNRSRRRSNTGHMSDGQMGHNWPQHVFSRIETKVADAWSNRYSIWEKHRHRLITMVIYTNKAARNHNDTIMIRVTDLNIVILFYCYQCVRACLIRQHNDYVTNIQQIKKLWHTCFFFTTNLLFLFIIYLWNIAICNLSTQKF